ncbi:MAG: TetR/AcrR family transcriptional regulator [Thermodesulfobacteriota bacterium]|nr:TetR/AcrR family transcriptional regulator [Thermodesulfobacteriota bacterium]
MVEKKSKHKKAWEAFVKEGILKAAVKVLSTHGLHGLTMDKVAMEAGVAKGTLYAYFKDKKKLVKSAVEATLDPLVTELLTLLDGDLLPDKKLEEFATCYLSYFDANKDFFRVFLYEHRHEQPQRRRYRSSRYLTFIEKIARVVDDGVKAGLFRPLDPLKVASLFIEANIAIVIHRLWHNISGHIEDDAGFFTEVFFKGIATGQAPHTSQECLKKGD